MKNFFRLIFSIIACELIGFATIPVTLSSIPTWYARLIKPSINPPDWIFGPVWTILYALMGISLFLISKAKTKKDLRKQAIRFFTVQLLFNFLWSLLFFGGHSPVLGLLDIIALLIALSLTLFFFWKISKKAFYILFPYFVWVCFATVLNASIVFLNK